MAQLETVMDAICLKFIKIEFLCFFQHQSSLIFFYRIIKNFQKKNESLF